MLKPIKRSIILAACAIGTAGLLPSFGVEPPKVIVGGGTAKATPVTSQASTLCNARIVSIVTSMPQGGGYATSQAAIAALGKAVKSTGNALIVNPKLAQPSFCSGATYLVFTKLLSGLVDAGQLRLTTAELQRLEVRGQSDGVGVWGRWNANGPGVARMFHDFGLGPNFESFDDAQPGDFMKVFWSDEIGAREFGHLVVYLGRHTDATGTTQIRFWSSNRPGGFGIKDVPITKIHWAIFSRLLYPQGIRRLLESDTADPVSRQMLKRSYTRDEVRPLVGIRPHR